MPNQHVTARKLTGKDQAAILLVRLYFRYVGALKDGHKDAALSRETLAKETGFSPKQLRTWIDFLRAGGWVTTRRGLFRNKNVCHFTISNEVCDALKGKKKGTFESAQVGSYVEAHTASSDSAKKGTFNIPRENTKREHQEITPSEPSLASDPPTPQEASGKDDEMKKPVGSVADVLKASQLHHKPDHSLKMGDLWVQLVNETTGKYVPPITNVDRKKLNDFAGKCPGKNGSPVLRYVVERWIEFVKRVEIDAGVKSTPALPNIDFLLKHVWVAVNFATSPKTVPEKQQEVVSHGTSVPDVQLTANPKVQPHKPATKAEILAILNEPDEDEDQGN